MKRVIVTGAAGFIGTNIVRALNGRGIDHIIAVDHCNKVEKVKNLVGCHIDDYLDKHAFLEKVAKHDFSNDIDAIFHQGACTDTTVTDGCYMMENNYRASVVLYEWAKTARCAFIYASSAAVYGVGRSSREAFEPGYPDSFYGYSKYQFDQYVKTHTDKYAPPVAGLRYFNVYGPYEFHKGRMSSMVYQAYCQYQERGFVELFEGSHGYSHGEHRRDFVFVNDVVKANLYCLDKGIAGIFDVGTGCSESFNSVAEHVINTIRLAQGLDPLTVLQLQDTHAIRYIPLPEGLKKQYQPFTQADLSTLRETGFDQLMTNVAEGVAQYTHFLLEHHS